ncbi:unnamed protein product [Phytophthora fragariaefolia]|uniref:Unnamed protein product n=1 Tax=Phytophthora fragariaefolia TaxID=1490495 RepID=A0A9W7CRB4_9STRA|nr:unnamed protein product [Phytophthora fragariaefolia]
MWAAGSYNEIFFMVDTCQAGSLSNALESPKVVTIDILGRSINEVPITDFLGSMLDVHLHSDDEAYPIEATPTIANPSPETSTTGETSDVLDASSQRGVGGTLPPAYVQSFQFTEKFLAGAVAAVICAVFVTMKGV